MSKNTVVAETKHDKALVAQGRKEERVRNKREREEDKVDKLKRERNELRRDVDELEAEVDAGKVSHRVVTVVAGAVGTGGGLATQVFAIEPTTWPGWVKASLIPTVGLAIGAVGLFVDGMLGAGMTGFGAGAATGSGAVTGVKKALGL